MRLWRVEFLWLGLVCAILVLAVWWLPGSGLINTDSYSVATSGKKAFYLSLRRLEDFVDRSTEQLIPNPYEPDRLLILGPARYPSEEEWIALYEEVEYGATLVFAASSRDPELDTGLFGVKVRSHWVKLQTEAEEDNSKEAETNDGKTSAEKGDDSTNTSLNSTDKTESDDPPEEKKEGSPDDDDDLRLPMLENYTAETELVVEETDWRTEASLEFDDADEWEVLLTADSEPQVARRYIGSGTVVFLAADSVFSNKAMTDPKQALLAYRIIEAAPSFGVTWFDETLNSSGVPKVFGILFDPEIRPVTLQCILIAALFGWAGSIRFGPVVQTNNFRRRSIVEHANALGILYFRTKAGSHAVQCLHEFFKLELRSVYGSSIQTNDPATVARLVQSDEAEVRDVLSEIETADKRELATSTAGRTLRRLSRFLSRIRSDEF